VEILVVEDEEGIADFLSRGLEAEGLLERFREIEIGWDRHRALNVDRGRVGQIQADTFCRSEVASPSGGLTTPSRDRLRVMEAQVLP
jgi:CheY-like chemotaxis protein